MHKGSESAIVELKWEQASLSLRSLSQGNGGTTGITEEKSTL